MKETGLITAREIELAGDSIGMALKAGADAVRVSLSKCVQTSITVLDGKTDNIAYNADRSLFFHIFADGRYGTFSTNRLETGELQSFIREATSMVRALAPDNLHRLPLPWLKASGCTDGNELRLYDDSYQSISQEEKMEKALGYGYLGKSCPLVESCESEYSDNLDDNLIMDSDGFLGRHTETSFGMSCEVTVKSASGERFSAYHFDSSPFCGNFSFEGICDKALEKALAKQSPAGIRSGRYNVIIDESCASRLLSPVISALDAQNVQQGNSFLAGSLGRRVFPEGFFLKDLPLTKGCPGSRLFDTEGTATKDRDIIRDGVLTQFFVNTYMAAKTGMAPTVEGISRPICNISEKGISLDSLMDLCRDGLYITSFNGGNCNTADGSFSFGAEGIAFENGRLTHPFRETVITGSILQLWNSLIALGDDCRACKRWQIPSLAFEKADINA